MIFMSNATEDGRCGWAEISHLSIFGLTAISLQLGSISLAANKGFRLSARIRDDDGLVFPFNEADYQNTSEGYQNPGFPKFQTQQPSLSHQTLVVPHTQRDSYADSSPYIRSSMYNMTYTKVHIHTHLEAIESNLIKQPTCLGWVDTYFILSSWSLGHRLQVPRLLHTDPIYPSRPQ